MKTIDIESKKKILKRARKTLNCILEAKKRIEGCEENIRTWQHFFFYSKDFFVKEIENHKAAIVRLESIYKKIISQL